jgi:N-sulfoglucosamine sulfohydrolase
MSWNNRASPKTPSSFTTRITDGEFKYIRCFSPHLPGAPYSSYAFGQPSWKAWKEAAAAGKLSGYHHEIWQATQPVELLFDLKSDPWEIHNVAAKPELAERLKAMRGKLREIMVNTRDTSMVPEKMWQEVAAGGTIHGHVANVGDEHAAWVDLAFLATSGSITPELEAAFESPSPVARYWAASGCLFHPGEAAHLAGKLGKLAEDPSPVVRRRAAEALASLRN